MNNPPVTEERVREIIREMIANILYHNHDGLSSPKISLESLSSISSSINGGDFGLLDANLAVEQSSQIVVLNSPL